MSTETSCVTRVGHSRMGWGGGGEIVDTGFHLLRTVLEKSPEKSQNPSLLGKLRPRKGRGTVSGKELGRQELEFVSMLFPWLRLGVWLLIPIKSWNPHSFSQPAPQGVGESGS